VVILTTPSTASASEIVINALKPYIEVITVGGTTSGKPFISTARSFCGLSMNAMEAEGFNAAGVSVNQGIAADCFATDDLSQDFGLAGGNLEGLAQAGADYLVFGRCDGAAIASAGSLISSKSKTLALQDDTLPGGAHNDLVAE